jgi:hypothetical protein
MLSLARLPSAAVRPWTGAPAGPPPAATPVLRSARHARLRQALREGVLSPEVVLRATRGEPGGWQAVQSALAKHLPRCPALPTRAVDQTRSQAASLSPEEAAHLRTWLCLLAEDLPPDRTLTTSPQHLRNALNSALQRRIARIAASVPSLPGGKPREGLHLIALESLHGSFDNDSDEPLLPAIHVEAANVMLYTLSYHTEAERKALEPLAEALADAARAFSALVPTTPGDHIEAQLDWHLVEMLDDAYHSHDGAAELTAAQAAEVAANHEVDAEFLASMYADYARWREAEQAIARRRRRRSKARKGDPRAAAVDVLADWLRRGEGVAWAIDAAGEGIPLQHQVLIAPEGLASYLEDHRIDEANACGQDALRLKPRESDWTPAHLDALLRDLLAYACLHAIL